MRIFRPSKIFCFLFKQKTAYEMRISDWSSDVCSSDLSVNIPSAGRIPGGASVEQAVATGFADSPSLTFNLAEADLTTALRVADAINQTFGDNRAHAMD